MGLKRLLRFGWAEGKRRKDIAGRKNNVSKNRNEHNMLGSVNFNEIQILCWVAMGNKVGEIGWDQIMVWKAKILAMVQYKRGACVYTYVGSFHYKGSFSRIFKNLNLIHRDIKSN